MGELLPFRDSSLPVETRLEDLISRMTLPEKVAQLCTTSGFKMYEITPGGEVRPTKELEKLYAKFPGCGLSSVFRADWFSGRNWQTGLRPEMLIKAHNALQRFAVEQTRLGIPLALQCGQMLGQTTLPSGLACAATFDTGAIAEGTRVKVEEVRTVSRAYGIGHPTCDLALDPRWSRVEQTFGEDPFLSAEINFARCRKAREMGGTASLAHFIAHGCGEGGRMSMPVHAGMNELLNLHMRPFEYAIRGGATGIMTCYNLIDGVPGLLRGDLVNDFVRGKLGFQGSFTADAGAIGALVWQGFARDLGEAAALAVKNGNDRCCWEAENYLTGLTLALERGLVTEAQIDDSVRRVLMGKFRAGLFEHPYTDEEWTARHGRPEVVIGSREHRDVALTLARKAITLLENGKGVLPLDARKIRRLAVIGPNADKPANQVGDYTAPQREGQTVTPRMGFEALGRELGFDVVYARGCKVRSMRRDGFAEALAAARDADAVVLCLGGSSVPDRQLNQNEAGTALANGEEDDAKELDKDAGEGFDRATLRLGGIQNELLAEIAKLGKPVVTVLIMGRPLVLDEVLAQSDAVLLAWYPGCEGGTAIAETVFGLNNPGGKLPVSFPRSEGAIPCYYHALTPRGNYVDMPCSPRYPFGYGLSYTKFEISNPILIGNTVRVVVKNIGATAGDDVVQMYLRDVVATVARPRWELRGFQRVSLSPGEAKEVVFTLAAKELGYWNREAEYVVEPGVFLVAVSDRFDEEAFEKGVAVAKYVLPEKAGPAKREKVIFDTDIGGDPDDALALAYLLSRPDCELLGVTIEAWGGNGPRQAEIASAICHDFGIEIPIAVGAGAGNLSGPRAADTPKKPPRYWRIVQGHDHATFSRRGGAVEFLRKAIRENPGEVTLLATGHFTNLGALFASDPEIPSLLKRLVVMGGNMSGNVEWNAHYDPVATALVFMNGNTARPPETLVLGADVTATLRFSQDEGRRLMAGIPAMALVAEASECWYREGKDLFFHDPMAAAAIFRPELFSWKEEAVRVDFAHGGGTTPEAAPCADCGTLKVATAVDAEAFLEELKATAGKAK